MGPTILQFGRLTISSYAALVSLGIILGLAVACLESKWRGADFVITLDAALWSLVAGVVGGRVVYVAIFWPYFSSHPRQIFSLSQGGLAFQGAFVAGLLGLLAYSLLNRRSFRELLDPLALGLALGQAVGWVGCLLAGCGYGLAARGFLAYDLRDIYGIWAYRYPTQAMISVLNLGIFLVLLILARTGAHRRLPPGTLAVLYLVLSSAGLFFLEFLRADETLYLGTLRWSQIVEVVEFVAALLALILLRTRYRRAIPPELTVSEP
jgi:phosphatidylglycerol:prolipoprotein diacylglycerol transferase